MVDHAFALRAQRLKAKKPVAAQAAQAAQAEETAAPLLPQQPKSLQGIAPSREEALADIALEEKDEKDDAPCPAGDPPPGGRAERPCDFPAVEGSLSATDASARLRALYKQSRTVMQKAHGLHRPEGSDVPSTAGEVSAEAIQMFKLVEDWMNALGLEDDF